MNQGKKLEDLFDLSKLSESSIRKYQSYFQINCAEDELLERIKFHFNNDLKLENTEVIDKFLELKREDKTDKKQVRNVRNPRPPN